MTNETYNALELLNAYTNPDSQMLGAEMLYYQGEYGDLFKWLRKKNANHKGFAIKYKDVVVLAFIADTVYTYKGLKEEPKYSFYTKDDVTYKGKHEVSSRFLKTITETQKLRILENIAENVCDLIEKLNNTLDEGT